MALQSIHTPLEVPAAYLAMYPALPEGSEQRLILAMVTALDDTVGNITAALKANRAVWNNTLMIFHSDNGGDSHGNNYPLRAGKFTLWQGGLNVVAVVSGGLMAHCGGAVTRGIVAHVDWYLTFANLAGATVNASGPRPLDSIDVWQHLQSCGKIPSPRIELLHHFVSNTSGAFRAGDMKLILPGTGGDVKPWCWDTPYPQEVSKRCRAGRPDPHPVDWSCVPCNSTGPRPCEPNGCLFNISADPNEHNDLSARMPALVARMSARFRALGASVCTRAENNCIDYISAKDQAKWVNQTIATMWITSLKNAGPALPPAPVPSPQPPPPPPPGPPHPPVNPTALLGSWSMAIGTPEFEITLATAHGDAAASVSGGVRVVVKNTGCTGCCWTGGMGVISLAGTQINVTVTTSATGPPHKAADDSSGDDAYGSVGNRSNKSGPCIRHGFGRLVSVAGIGMSSHSNISSSANRLVLQWQCTKGNLNPNAAADASVGGGVFEHAVPPSTCNWKDWLQL